MHQQKIKKKEEKKKTLESDTRFANDAKSSFKNNRTAEDHAASLDDALALEGKRNNGAV
jgi:hypothetical protein